VPHRAPRGEAVTATGAHPAQARRGVRDRRYDITATLALPCPMRAQMTCRQDIIAADAVTGAGLENR
jgi:hypothetical protein